MLYSPWPAKNAGPIHRREPCPCGPPVLAPSTSLKVSGSTAFEWSSNRCTNHVQAKQRPMFERINQLVASVYHWVSGQVTAPPTDTRVVTISVIALVVTYLVLAFLVRRLLPWFVRSALLPLTALLAGVLGSVLLGLQAVATLLFRIVDAHPPVTLYRVGTVTETATGSAVRGTRAMARWFRTARPVRSRVVLIMTAAAVVWWNQVSCWPGVDGPTCQRPVWTVAQAASRLTTDILATTSDP